MGKWRYFSDDESAGLDDELISRLDVARGLCGFPIVITSGRRTPEQNVAAGGVAESSHMMGLAVDIHMPPGQNEREKLIWSLGRAGFRRVGIYSRHAHCDVDDSKAQDVVWFGISH